VVVEILMAKVTSRDGVSLKFQRKILLFWRRVPRVVPDDWLEFRTERGRPTLSNTLPGLADKRRARPVCVCIRHFPNAAPSKIPGRAPQTQKKSSLLLPLPTLPAPFFALFGTPLAPTI